MVNFRKLSIMVLSLSLATTSFPQMMATKALQKTNVLISEYVHQENGQKAIELYNNSQTQVSLENFTLALKGLDQDNQPLEAIMDLNGQTIDPQATIVIYPDTQKLENIPNSVSSSSSFFNYDGNDAIILLENNEIVDSIGTTKDFNENEMNNVILQRKDDNLSQDQNLDDHFNQADFNVSDQANLGQFQVRTIETKEVEVKTTNPLIISEYYHNASNRKAIEIYNTSSDVVNLDNVEIGYSGYTSTCGIATPAKQSLVGYEIAPYSTFVLYNASTSTTDQNTINFINHMKALPNALGKTSGPTTNMNGDDRIELYVGGQLVDSFGSTQIPCKDTTIGSMVKSVRNDEVSTGDINLDDAFDLTQWNLTKEPSDLLDLTTLGEHEFAGAPQAEDTKAPVIEHTPVTSGLAQNDLTISAVVSDNVKINNVALNWRFKGETDYRVIDMRKVNDQYEAKLPLASFDKKPEVEYFIQAFDGQNTATTEVYVVTLDMSDVDAPIIKATTPRKSQSLGEVSETDVVIELTEESNIDSAKTTLRVDGNHIAINVDQTTKTISSASKVALTDGEHEAVVVVFDEFGNNIEYTWSFKTGVVKYEHYTGQIHSHSTISDGSGTIEEAYRYASSESDLDFFAVTDHSNSFDNDSKANITDGSVSSEWVLAHETADRYNKDGEFTAFYAYEMSWSGSTGGYGHMNTFNTPGFETRTNATMRLEQYYAAIASQPQSISQFNHPGTTFGDFSNFGSYSPATDAVVTLIEVGNGEGAVGSNGYWRSYDYYTRALDRGWHVAPTNGQDNHKGLWGTSNETRTVAIAESQTREGIYDAFRQMRTYATEDRNLTMDYYLNGAIMGSQLPETDEVNIAVNVRDEDSNEAIGKVSIIADGGVTVASKYFDSNNAQWNIALPAEYSYYYIKVEQPDKEWAVSAPVWVGEKQAVTLNEIKTATDKVIVGDEITLTTSITNNSATSLNDLEVEWYEGKIEGTPIATTTITSIASGKVGSATTKVTAKKVGKQSYYARVKVNDKWLNASKDIEIVNANEVQKIIIDGSKYNQYVTGNYAGKMANFTRQMADRNVIVTITPTNSTVTRELLDTADIFITTDPEGTGDPRYNIEKANYSQAEIDAIASYVKDGGNIIVTSRADYKDALNEYSNAAQINPLLEAIGTHLRVNDDQLIDNVTNGGQAFRLQFTNYSDAYGLNAGIDQGDIYTYYSGSSVYSTNGAMDKSSCLVFAHSTTISDDADRHGDNRPLLPGETACAIAADQLSTGGKVVVAGTTFFSDFEIGVSDNMTTNPVLTNNIINWMAPPIIPAQVSIKEFRNAPAGSKFTIKGVVTSGSYPSNPVQGFFDTIYIQDLTGGVTVFGVSEREFNLGDIIEVTGYVDEYQGDIEIVVSNEFDAINLVSTHAPLEATVLSTNEAMQDINQGLLVKTTGKVEMIDGQELVLNDGSGQARIFVDGYIGSNANSLVGGFDQNIKVGDTVEAIGLASKDPLGARLRVRDTAEVKIIVVDEPEVDEDKPNKPEKPSHPVHPEKPTHPIHPEKPIKPLHPHKPEKNN